MDRYELGEVIGEGSFGRVFRGRDAFTNERVAIKIISKNATTTMLQLDSWKGELEIQKALRHPNIIRMMDSVETPDYIFLITEYAKGDMYKLYISNGPTPLPLVQDMACNLVSALYYLHDNRILHRDLKPQNILIGYDNRPKLCDFGFARRIDIDTYVITSFKGTPLYMAPEIVQEEPYDQNADLWSLGCILFELCCGQPPFPPLTIFQHGRNFQSIPIFWPELITGHCKSFLWGLLERDPQKRLSWPHLLDHPFINDMPRRKHPGEEFSLTKALSPSQELVKEKQRQSLQKKLNTYSKLLSKTARKMESARKQLKSYELAKPSPSPPSSEASSVESLTSSSGSMDSDGVTVIDPKSPVPKMDEHSGHGSKANSKNIQDTISAIENLHLDERSSSRLYDILWISEGLYNVHSGDKPIESEEWIIFMGKTMREVEANPSCLCDKHFLSMLVTPLGNHLAEVGVVETIATLLAMPFTMCSGNEELKNTLENIYFAGKVLPNLVYACKLMVRRRLLEKISLKSGDLVRDLLSIVKEEDLVGMDKCLRLITFLAHTRKDFVEQFCECVCRFKIFPILFLCLKAYDRRMRLTVDTLSVLCHIMRAGESRGFREFLKDYEENCQEINSEVFNLMSHADPNVQSKAIRLIGYLMTYCEAARKKLICPNATQLWKILTQASNHTDGSISSAAEFTSGQLQQLVPSKSQNGSQEKD